MPEEYEGPEEPENLEDPPAFFPLEGGIHERAEGSPGDLIEVQVEGVFVAENGGQASRFVLVSDGERKLPILIGPFEAQAIQLVLESNRPDRPMTHDLIKSVLDRLGAVVDRAVIDDFWNTVYYAKLYLRTRTEEIEIDARPSDAIAVAIRFGAQIYVAESILVAAMDE